MEESVSLQPNHGPIPSSNDDQPAKGGQNSILFGRQGLRAGWSVLIFLVIFLVCGMAANAALHLLMHGGKGSVSPRFMMVVELVQIAIMLLATWIMARVEGRELATYGYAGTARLSRFLWGCVWGFIAISVLVGTLWKSHLLAFDAGHLAALPALKFGLGWLGVFLCVGFLEESLLRGYLQYTLTRGMGFWWGALLLSVLFGASHLGNHGESPVGLFSAAAVGMVFCISLWYTGSLWWAIGFHAIWDWGQTYFYGTPDSGLVARGHLLSEHPVGPLLWSGGPTGPEGSIFVVALLALMALAMWLWWGRKSAGGAFQIES